MNVRHSFELVEGLKSHLYIYSALWNVKNVRLESIKVKGYVFQNLQCVFYYTLDNSKPDLYVKSEIKQRNANGLQYVIAHITCPITKNEFKGKIPMFVGFVENALDKPRQLFPVEHLSQSKEVTHEFTECVPAMHEWANAALLVEKIEMGRLFGAGRIVLYDTSISPSVDAVLRMYAREWAEGRETLEVVVLPWKLPKESGEQIPIHYWAQELAMDDCLYRYKRLSKYIVFDDLDEFLVPFKHDNWSALVEERQKLNPKSIGWLFRSSVFSKNIPSVALGYEQDYLRYRSSILGLTMRDEYIYPKDIRPKLIVNPGVVEEMGVHLISKGTGSTDILPVDVGLLFHYRKEPNCCRRIKDTRLVFKYGDRLVARLKEIWSKLPGVGLGWSPLSKINCTIHQKPDKKKIKQCSRL